MNKKLPLLLVLNLMIPLFAICSHASIQKCDVSLTRGGGIDGRDLAQFAAYYAASNSRADVDESGVVDSADVAHFAGFFGESYRLPNILLIISDDVGLDMNTNMYPGLIDDLLDLYGPDGWNHENYLSINNPPEHLTASTPALDRLASEAKVFSNAWAHPFCDHHSRYVCSQNQRQDLRRTDEHQPYHLRAKAEGRSQLQHRRIRKMASRRWLERLQRCYATSDGI
jgi:hypothetical protein